MSGFQYGIFVHLMKFCCDLCQAYSFSTGRSSVAVSIETMIMTDIFLLTNPRQTTFIQR